MGYSSRRPRGSLLEPEGLRTTVEPMGQRAGAWRPEVKLRDSHTNVELTG